MNRFLIFVSLGILLFIGAGASSTTAIDTLEFDESKDSCIVLPRVYSANCDALCCFKPQFNCNLSYIQLKMFNRWGNILLTESAEYPTEEEFGCLVSLSLSGLEDIPSGSYFLMASYVVSGELDTLTEKATISLLN